MQIGWLRHRVMLQEPNAPGQDVTGAMMLTWATVRTVWADVRTVGGQETHRPDVATVVSGYTHTVTIRRPEVTVRTTWRVVWQGRIFQVIAIREPDNRGRMVLLDCAEVEV